jgi:hypothetical protein
LTRRGLLSNASTTPYTVPKTWQISEKIREEVPWRELYPVIHGNDDYCPLINRKFPYRGFLLFAYKNLQDFCDSVLT